MARLGLVTFALVLVASGFYQGVSARKPTIFPREDEIVIQEGDELKIECEGEGRLKFSTQTLILNVERSNFSITGDEDSGRYTFIRPRTMGSDTGWYACAEEGIDIRNDEKMIDHPSDDISWIYVYVNSSQPFAVTEALYDVIPVTAGSSAVIPCRPTSPGLEVVLHSEASEGELIPQPPYDSKIGFILNEVAKQQNFENFVCLLRGFDEWDRDDWPRYTLHVADPRPLENPVINEEQLRHVVSGKNLILDCTITVAVLTRFELRWKAPDSVPKDRLVQNPVVILDRSPTKETWRRELIVTEVQHSDAGEYICIADGIGGHSTNSSITIKIWDPSYTYINVSVEGEKHIKLKEKEFAQWAMTIDTYPQEFEWMWLKEDGTLIEATEADGRNKYSHQKDGLHHVFRISNLVMEDTGNYTIRIRTPKNETSIDLPLTVFGQPVVTLHNTLLYYAPGQSAIVKCNAIALPSPNISWNYIEYPGFPSKENHQLIPISNVTTKKMDERLSLVSLAYITINMTGDVVCRSCNEIDCTESTQPIFVSDVAGFFGIRYPEIVTEGDDINVTCGASLYNFTNSVIWKPSNSTNQGEFDWDRIHVINRTTKFTSQAILHISRVRKSDSGDYVCEAVTKDGLRDTQEYQLLVEDARTPKFVFTNLNNSEIVIDLEKDKNVAKTLECRADGRPIPKVTWLKNNQPLMQSKQYKFSENNSRLHIAYFLDGDSGKYLCHASNRVGTVEKYIDIQIAGKSQSQNNIIWISLICVLIVIIIVVITYMGIKVHRERVLRKELFEAGLTHFEEGALECLNPDLTVDDQAELLPYDKKWEFPRELLKLGKQLGSGAFGVVMKAEARGICEEGEVTTVAVKMVRRTAEPSYMKALSSELKIMIHLGRHLNVVNLLGACTKTILTKRELYVIVEYCRFGNLHNYLQRHRASFIDQIDSSTQKIDPNIGKERLVRSESVGSQNRLKYAALSFSRSLSIRSSDSNSGNELVDYRQGTDFGDVNMSPDGGVLSNNSVQPGWRSNYRGDYKDHNLMPICTQDLLCWAWQVSRGMEYLSARNVLHGDLAARNILLADDNIVKICDFGLAKNMYKDNNYKKKGDGPLPIKWMAIESIRDRIFSTQSDIWSFGIVLWEFFTLAQTPYPGMEAETQYNKLIEGYRMEKPEYATDEIYDFMLQCWKAKPSLRPSFPELVEKIGTLLTESTKLHYLDLNTPYMDMNTANLQNGQSDYLTMMSAPSHDYHNAPEPMLEARPDSAYLSMSPSNMTSDPGIFSPRSELEESHFSFPSPNKNSPINSDTEDGVESVPMLEVEDPYAKPIDVQQRRAEFAKQSKVQTPVERDSGYCNVTSNPRISNSNNQSSGLDKNFDQSLNPNVLMKNNNKMSPSIISGNDNYVNMPQQKNDRSKDTVDSFSNPSYVMMSKLENDRQLV